MNTIINYKNILAVAFLLLAVTLAMLVLQNPKEAGASIRSGDEYLATSTSATTVYGAFASSQVIVSGPAAFGSVIITGANTGTLNFYNATTSDVNKRTNNTATSTILIASFPASAAAGTYTFDVQVTDGLYIDILGLAATSTVTYRK